MRVVDVELGVEVEHLGNVGDRLVDMVKEVDVDLVLEVLVGVDVELTEVQVNAVGGDHEAPVLDAVPPGELKRPMLGSVFDDIDDVDGVVAMRVVDVETGCRGRAPWRR
eukprot:87677-Amphidinium_carterae.1